MEIIRFVQSFSHPLLDRFFTLVTMVGEDYFFIVTFAIMYWCVNKKFGYRLGFAYLSSGVINIALKETFQVPRPVGLPGIRSLRLETAGGYSFPSGHSQVTATLWTFIMLEAKRKWVYVLGIGLIFLVTLSRIYLGVHTPIDVLGGMAIGVSWVFISNFIFSHAEETGNKAVFGFFVVPMIIGLFIFPTSDYFKVAGTVVSILAGYIIESTYIQFHEKAVLWKQVTKVVTGLTGLLVIRIAGKSLLPPTPYSDFFRYFLMGLWMTIIAPYFFTISLSNHHFTQPQRMDRF